MNYSFVKSGILGSTLAPYGIQRELAKNESCDFVCFVLIPPRPLRNTKGSAELCEACDTVCLALRAKFVNERQRIYKFG